MSNWITIGLNDRKYLPESPGVYVIYFEGLKYVGSASNLKRRLLHHEKISHSSSAERDKYKIKIRLTTKFGQWLMDELRLIRRLQPEWNNIGIKKLTTEKPYKKLLNKGVFKKPYTENVTIIEKVKYLYSVKGKNRKEIANYLNSMNLVDYKGYKWSEITVNILLHQLNLV